MRRSVARCKRCGTEFVMEGEISGCPNCHHGEFDCFPQDFEDNSLELFEDIPNEELVQLAEDLTKMEEDDFMTELMAENTLTQAFLEELERELDQIELPEKYEEPKETPYEKGQRLLKEKSALEEAGAFDLEQCFDCGNDCEGCEHHADIDEAMRELFDEKERTWTNPKAVKKIVKGRCRSCAYWNKLDPQAGSCQYLVGQAVQIKMWYDTCGKYIRSINYDAQQVEIRERRKAHESIIRAMERSRG